MNESSGSYTNIPPNSNDLIDLLDNQYPEATPHRNMSQEDIWIAIGQREVIRNLLMRQKLATEQSLENTLNVS